MVSVFVGKLWWIFINLLACINSTGDFHCLALSVEGDVYSWGQNDHGQCGVGSTVSQNLQYTFMFFCVCVIMFLKSRKIRHYLVILHIYTLLLSKLEQVWTLKGVFPCYSPPLFFFFFFSWVAICKRVDTQCIFKHYW